MARELDPKNPKEPLADDIIEIVAGVYDEMLEELSNNSEKNKKKKRKSRE